MSNLLAKYFSLAYDSTAVTKSATLKSNYLSVRLIKESGFVNPEEESYIKNVLLCANCIDAENRKIYLFYIDTFYGAAWIIEIGIDDRVQTVVYYDRNNDIGFDPKYKIYNPRIVNGKIIWTDNKNAIYQMDITRAKKSFAYGIGYTPYSTVEWTEVDIYLTGQIVSYGKKIYKAVTNSLNVAPGYNTDIWEEICLIEDVYYSMKIENFYFAPMPPSHPPTVEYFSDDTRKINSLKQTLFQIAYRYVYMDWRKSTISPASIVALPQSEEEASSGLANEQISLNNYLKISVNTGTEEVRAIEIIARSSDDPSTWYLIETVEKFTEEERQQEVSRTTLNSLLKLTISVPAPTVVNSVPYPLGTPPKLIISIPDPTVILSNMSGSVKTMEWDDDESGAGVAKTSTITSIPSGTATITAIPAFINVFNGPVPCIVGTHVNDGDILTIYPSTNNLGAERSGNVITTDSYGNFVSISVLQHMAATGYYQIDPTGQDISTRDGKSLAQAWKSLSYACTRVTAAGNTIHVNPGTYIETAQSVLREGVSIEGSGITSIIHSHITTIGTFTIRAESDHSGTNGNQHISGIKMEGESNAYGAIKIAYRGNVRIYNCTVVDFKYYGVSFINGEPPTTYATGNKFHDNIVTNCSGYYTGNRGCLEMQGQDGMLVYANTLNADRGGANCGDVIYAVEGFLKNCKIYNNTLIKTYYPGVSSWDFAIEGWNWLGGNEIYDNQITGSIDVSMPSKGSSPYSVWIHDNVIGQAALKASQSTRGIIIELSSEGVLIERNLFHDISTGIYLQQQGGVRIVNNIDIRTNIFYNIGSLVNSTGWGIRWSVEDYNDIVSNIRVWNNVFIAVSNAYSTMWGIGLPDIGTASNVSIRNNIVAGFDYAPVFASGTGGTTINILSIENNIFWGNGYSNAPRYNGITPTNNTTQNNIIDNPDFVSAVDFHLQNGSPAIDAGIDVGLTTDFDGVVVDDPPEIGAYEKV